MENVERLITDMKESLEREIHKPAPTSLKGTNE
jgi:hypothetical protein